jgi:hypothetical protein
MTNIITKCGNEYTPQEWEDMMVMWDEEVAGCNDYFDRMSLIKKTAGRHLEALGLDNGYAVACHILENGTDGISFSSDEKREAVEALDKWMVAEERKASRLL